MSSFNALLSGFIRCLSRFCTSFAECFSQPEEDTVISGVKKIGSYNGSLTYVFPSEIVGGMTREKYAKHLEETGFLEKCGLGVSLEENSRIISFMGDEFPRDQPRMTFAGNGALLSVPFSSDDDRDWDRIAEKMKALFGEPDKAP